MDIVYAWLASIASGLEPIVIKLSSRSLIKNPWLFNFLWVAARVPLIMVFALLYRDAGLPENIPLAVALSFSGAGFYIFYTLAIFKLDVSTMGPLFSIRTAFAVLMGVFLLGEGIGLFGALLVLLILLASPLASYNEHLRAKAFWQKSTFLAVLAMFSLAVNGLLINKSVAANGYGTTLLWKDLGAVLLLTPTLKLVGRDMRQFTIKRLRPFFLLSLSGFLVVVSSAAAYANNLALSSVIISLPLSMIFAVLLSRKYGVLLEKHPKHVYAVRFAGAFIMVGSAIILSLTR